MAVNIPDVSEGSIDSDYVAIRMLSEELLKPEGWTILDYNSDDHDFLGVARPILFFKENEAVVQRYDGGPWQHWDPLSHDIANLDLQDVILSSDLDVPYSLLLFEAWWKRPVKPDDHICADRAVLLLKSNFEQRIAAMLRLIGFNYRNWRLS